MRGKIQVERPAEFVRAAADVALAEGARRPIGMAAEDVAPQPAEELVEHALAQPSGAARGKLEALAAALGVAGFLEQLGQLLEPAQVRRGLGVEQLGDLVRIDAGQLLWCAHVFHLARRARPCG